MRHSRPQQYLAADLRAIAYGESIDLREWLTLAPPRSMAPAPSADAAGYDPAAQGDGPWNLTLPAGLDSLPPVRTFDEPLLRGLVMREVAEPAVFHRFFGAASNRPQAI